MTQRLTYGTVRDTKRQAIYVLRVADDTAELAEIDDLVARMSNWLAHRGEPTADIVVVQGDRKETLRLSGSSYSVGRVRAAMFNAEITWNAIKLD